MRVVRFYQSCSPPPPPPHPPPPRLPPPRSPDPSGHSRTSTASSRSQWAQPDLNRELQIAVGTAGPQPRAPDPSGHCRTSTASSRSLWALPDTSGHCRTSTATSRSQWALPDLNRDFQIAVGTAGPQREEKMSDRMPEDMSDRMPEDLPVRKCINVMAGINRSEVIMFFLFGDFILVILMYICKMTIKMLCFADIRNVSVQFSAQSLQSEQSMSCQNWHALNVRVNPETNLSNPKTRNRRRNA